MEHNLQREEQQQFPLTGNNNTVAATVMQSCGANNNKNNTAKASPLDLIQQLGSADCILFRVIWRHPTFVIDLWSLGVWGRHIIL